MAMMYGKVLVNADEAQEGLTVTFTSNKGVVLEGTVDANGKCEKWLPAPFRWKAELEGISDTFELETGGMAYCDIPLNANTFKGVQKILNAHREAELLEVGHTIPVTLTRGEIVDYQIYAINHDNEHEVIWGTKNALAEARYHNPSNTNAGGWNSSQLRTWLNNTYYETLLPEDVKEYVKDHLTKCSAGSQSANITVSTDKVWLPREYEIFGATTNAAATEQTQGGAKQFPIFAIAANRIKSTGRDGVTPVYWWESSPYVGSATGFGLVSTSGAANAIGGASVSYGVVPCFRQSADE